MTVCHIRISPSYPLLIHSGLVLPPSPTHSPSATVLLGLSALRFEAPPPFAPPLFEGSLEEEEEERERERRLLPRLPWVVLPPRRVAVS